MNEIWVERRVEPSLAWGHNRALCRAVGWFSASRSVHTTRINTYTHFIKLLNLTDQYGRWYLNRDA